MIYLSEAGETQILQISSFLMCNIVMISAFILYMGEAGVALVMILDL